MRTLPLVLVAAAALLSPAATLAAGPNPPMAAPGRYFVINGMLLGDQKAEASGKLSLEDGRLTASVGCNTIGGAATVDGDIVTIAEGLATTAMGCPGVDGETEAMLIKVLQHGPFTITASAWTGDGATLFTTELPSGPGPNASGGAPDDVVDSSPGPVIVDPGASCPPLPSGMGGGDGSTGSGTGSSGGIVPPDAGSGSGGSSGAGGGTTPGSGGDAGTGTSSGGSAPSSTAVAEPGTTTKAPAPPDPAGPPAPEESPTLGQTEPEPGLTGKPAPSEVVIVGPIEPAPSAIALPDPGTRVTPGSSFDIDPGFNGKPIPVDPCGRYYAVDLGSSAGSAIPPKTGDAAAEHATSGMANASSLSLPLGAALLGLFAIGGVGARRWWTTTHAVREGEGEGLEAPREGDGPEAS
jgi:heat shock protein HslJ